MKYNQGDVIEYEDGTKRLVLDSLQIEGQNYLLINLGDNDNTIVKYNDNDIVDNIEDDEEFDKILKLFVEKNRK